MDRIVSAERWMDLAARGGLLVADRYGFTHRAETRVWNWRSLPFHIMYLCLQGGFRVELEGGSVPVEKGSFIWIMPNVRNRTRLLAPRQSFRTFYIRFILTDEDGATPVRLARDWVHRHDAWPMLSHMRELVGELQSPQEFHVQRLHASLSMLSAMALGTEVLRERVVLTAQQRLRLHAYINSHVEKASPQELADEVGLSMPYFRRLFQRSYGMSPMQWIVRQRILLGALMLSETELTAKEVAYRLGYRDRHLFSRQFKQVMGVSARPFRRGTGAEPRWDHIDDDMTVAPILQRARAAARRVRDSAL